MSVATPTPTIDRTKGRSVKSWTNLTQEQKSALEELAKDNHMSTSEYQRVVLSFAIANRLGFAMDCMEPHETRNCLESETFRSLVSNHPVRVNRKFPAKDHRSI